MLYLSLFLKIGNSFSHAIDNVSIYGDFLVWHASEETSSTWASAISTLDNKVNKFDAANIRFGWSPGFRAGIGYEPDNFWDIQLYMTYFSTAKDACISYPNQIILPEFFNGFLSGNFFFNAAINWKILMNMIDLEIGHKFTVTRCLNMRPSIGLKGGFINQKINSIWDALLYKASEDLRNNFVGVGPSFKIDSEWNVYNRVALFGKLSTALMWGRWHINDTYCRPEALFGVITPTTILSNINNSMLGAPIFNLFMGLRWAYEASVSVAVQVGYEMQFWVNQLRLPTFQQLPVHGDLTLQGGVCSIYIGF